MEWTQQSDRAGHRETAVARAQHQHTPILLVLEAYLSLIQFDVYLARKDFAKLHRKVRDYPIGNRLATHNAIAAVCSAIDLACIWYYKEALCLQRSAATACLLRKYGVSAHLIIGAQQMPFKAHAWVEVDGRVVNDKPYVHELYARLDQC